MLKKLWTLLSDRIRQNVIGLTSPMLMLIIIPKEPSAHTHHKLNSTKGKNTVGNSTGLQSI